MGLLLTCLPKIHSGRAANQLKLKGKIWITEEQLR